jgi:hypothetical protein
MQTVQARLDHLVGCVWFWVWALVGFAIAFGAVSAFGIFLVFPVGVIAVLLAIDDRIRRSAFGLLTGGDCASSSRTCSTEAPTSTRDRGSSSASCWPWGESSATRLAATEARFGG